MRIFKLIKNGIIGENPIFVQVIGMCPTLALTTNAFNGIGMGLATMTVLACSNLIISLIRNFVPNKVRIPAFVVVIASFVTIVEFLLKAYFIDLYNTLGLYIPLIVVNCLILARAEAFASKNGPLLSLADGIGMGLGFTLALTVIGAVREFVGNGSLFGYTVLPEMFPRTIMAILPPGAFITLGLLMALFARLKNKGGAEKTD